MTRFLLLLAYCWMILWPTALVQESAAQVVTDTISSSIASTTTSLGPTSISSFVTGRGVLSGIPIPTQFPTTTVEPVTDRPSNGNRQLLIPGQTVNSVNNVAMYGSSPSGYGGGIASSSFNQQPSFPGNQGIQPNQNFNTGGQQQFSSSNQFGSLTGSQLQTGSNQINQQGSPFSQQSGGQYSASIGQQASGQFGVQLSGSNGNQIATGQFGGNQGQGQSQAFIGPGAGSQSGVNQAQTQFTANTGSAQLGGTFGQNQFTGNTGSSQFGNGQSSQFANSGGIQGIGNTQFAGNQVSSNQQGQYTGPLSQQSVGQPLMSQPTPFFQGSGSTLTGNAGQYGQSFAPVTQVPFIPTGFTAAPTPIPFIPAPTASSIQQSGVFSQVQNSGQSQSNPNQLSSGFAAQIPTGANGAVLGSNTINNGQTQGLGSQITSQTQGFGTQSALISQQGQQSFGAQAGVSSQQGQGFGTQNQGQGLGSQFGSNGSNLGGSTSFGSGQAQNTNLISSQAAQQSYGGSFPLGNPGQPQLGAQFNSNLNPLTAPNPGYGGSTNFRPSQPQVLSVNLQQLQTFGGLGYSSQVSPQPQFGSPNQFPGNTGPTFQQPQSQTSQFSQSGTFTSQQTSGQLPQTGFGSQQQQQYGGQGTNQLQNVQTGSQSLLSGSGSNQQQSQLQTTTPFSGFGGLGPLAASIQQQILGTSAPNAPIQTPAVSQQQQGQGNTGLNNQGIGGANQQQFPSGLVSPLSSQFGNQQQVMTNQQQQQNPSLFAQQPSSNQFAQTGFPQQPQPTQFVGNTQGGQSQPGFTGQGQYAG